MATFLRLTDMSGNLVRFNLDYIVSYHRAHDDDKRLWPDANTIIHLPDAQYKRVKETVEQIDDYMNDQ